MYCNKGVVDKCTTKVPASNKKRTSLLISKGLVNFGEIRSFAAWRERKKEEG